MPNATDAVADLGNVITAARTITLGGGPFTVGQVNFLDTTHDYTVNGGTLNLDVSAGTPTMSVVTGRTGNMGAVLTGSDGLLKTGAGLLVLSAGNSYTGLTTIKDSADNTGVTISNASALGATGASNSTLVQNVLGNTGGVGTSLRLQGGITVAEDITLNPTTVGGDHRVSIFNNSGTNNLTGLITLTGSGLAQFNSSSGVMNVQGDIIDSGFAGTLLVRGNGTNTITGSINIGTNILSKTDASTWNLGAAGETYSWGNTQVSVGTLRLNVANMLSPTNNVTLGQNDANGPTFTFNNVSQSINNLTYQTNGNATLSTGTGTLTLNGNVTTSGNGGHVLSGLVDLAGGTRTFTIANGTNANDLTVSAGVSNGGIIKAGAGTLRFTGNNTYAGTTTINQGVLSLSGTGALGGTSSISIASAAFFDVSGTTSTYHLLNGQSLINNGTVIGNLITDAGSDISPGLSIGLLNFNNDLDINGNLIIEIDPAGPGSVDMVNVLGLLDVTDAMLSFSLVSPLLDDAAYVFAKYGSLAGTFNPLAINFIPVGYEIRYQYEGNQIALVQIPEPASMSLLALGGLAMFRRRRATR